MTKTAKNSGGISLFTDETKSTYKSTYQLLKEISGVWDDLTDKQQAGLLEKLAGKRGGQVLAGVLEDFSEVERAMDEMRTAEGAADDEMAIIQDSIEYKLNSLKQTWVGVLQELISRGDIGKLIDSLTHLSEALGDNIKQWGVFGTVIAGALGVGTVKFIKNFGLISQTLSTLSQKGTLIQTLGVVGEKNQQLGKIIASMSTETAVATMAQQGLTKAQIAGALSASGLTGEQIKAALATAGLNAEEIELTGQTWSLSTAYKGLASALGISTGALTAFLAVAAGVTIAVTAITAYNASVKESARTAAESATAIHQTQNALQEQIKQYEELHDKLNDANITEAEQYDIKKQLWELQQNLNETYGEELGYLDLVNGKYETQLNLLRNITTEKAQNYRQEHQSDYSNALSRINAKNGNRQLDFDGLGLDQEVISFLNKYHDLQSIDEITNLPQYKINLKITDDEAVEYLRQLFDDVEQFGEATGAAVTDVLDVISKNIKDITEDETYQADKKLIKEFRLQSVLADDQLRKVYSDALDAVKEYNEALLNAENDPKRVKEAENNLNNIRTRFGELKNTVEGSEQVFDEVWDKINQGAAGAIRLQEALQNKGSATYDLAQKLQGVNAFELRGFDSEGKLTQAQQDFTILAHCLGVTKDRYDSLIDSLVQAQIVLEQTQNETEQVTEAEWDLNAALKEHNISSSDNRDDMTDEFNRFLKTFKELNPELAKNTELVEKAAVAQYIFDRSVEDLRSHFNDYEDSIKNANESSTEYINALNSMATDLSDLLGFEFTAPDTQEFMKSAENVDLLRKALDGDNEALDRLRQNAAVPIWANIDISTYLDTSTFNDEYNALMEWLATADLGSIEATAYLNESPFVEGLRRAIEDAKISTEAVKALFAALGWDADWVMKEVKSTFTPMEFDSRGYPHTGGSVTKTIAEIPTNIRFKPNGGHSSGYTPKVSKPTSSSGTNYKPEQKKGSGGGGGGGGADKAKDDEKEMEDTYDEFFDYFERRVKVVTDAIKLLDTNLSNVVGSGAKNKLLDAQMRLYKMQQKEYKDAQKMYQEMADRAFAKVPDNLKNDVKNGAVAIDEFIGKGNEEVVKAIQDYGKWADKVAECKEQLAQLKVQLRQLELARFKNIMQDFQDIFDLRESNALDLIKKQISLFEEAGELVGESFYTEQKEQVGKQLQAMEEARTKLLAELQRGLSNGTILKGSDEWKEMINILSDVEGKILDLKTAMEELDNAILNIHVEVFERIQNTFANYDDELSDIGSLMEDVDVSDKYGNWSEEGAARAGLLAQRYELAKKQVADYGKEIEWLNEQYKAGKYSSTEYADRLADLMGKQRDAAQAAESAKDEILELNRARVEIVVKGIEEEIEAYRKLIDAQKEALSATKDLHDYEKQLAESTKAIVDIERQLAAIQNDDSAAATAKRKQLEQQLSDARKNQEEEEYSHSIDSQQQALDEQMQLYEEQRQAEIDNWNAYLEKIAVVMEDTFNMVREKSAEIGETIKQVAQEHGIMVSTELITAWQAGENAIAMYGATLSAETSAFIGNLEQVSASTWQLQEQANQTSVSISEMFGNRADNLVGELERSWASEQNLDAATQALRDSFVQALDSGYRIGEVTAPIGSAQAATESLGSAADSAARSFDGLRSSAESAASAVRNMPTTATRGTPYEPPYLTKHVSSVYDGTGRTVKWYKDAQGRIHYAAKGLKKADKDELYWTQELGAEAIVSPTRNSILTPLKAGDSVLTAEKTHNLFELAKYSPEDIMSGFGANGTHPTVQRNSQTVLNFESAVTVNGNVNDSLSVMKIASQQAQSKIAETLKNLNDEIKY